MLHLVTAANAALYGPELLALHRMRRQVFVEGLGWGLRVAGDGGEYDEYDDGRALHLIGFGAEGQVVSGVRMRPADDRSMLGDHFADRLPPDMRAIADGRTWEVSRGFSNEKGVRGAVWRRRAAVMTAPLEIALAAGIDRYVGFTDVTLLPLYDTVGWRMRLLAEAAPYGEGDGVPYEAEVSAEVLAAIRAAWGLPAPCHVHIADLPAGETVHDAARRIAAADPKLAALLPDAAPVALRRPSLAERYAAG
jgi:acyl homoserine lactone synthase